MTTEERAFQIFTDHGISTLDDRPLFDAVITAITEAVAEDRDRLAAENAELIKLHEQRDQPGLFFELCATIDAMKAKLTALRQERDRLRAALQHIQDEACVFMEGSSEEGRRGVVMATDPKEREAKLAACDECTLSVSNHRHTFICWGWEQGAAWHKAERDRLAAENAELRAACKAALKWPSSCDRWGDVADQLRAAIARHERAGG